MRGAVLVHLHSRAPAQVMRIEPRHAGTATSCCASSGTRPRFLWSDTQGRI